MKTFKSIAIDGPSGAGKSDLSSILAIELGFLHVDTGALYRALSLHFLDKEIEPEYVSNELKSIKIDMKFEDNANRIFLNHMDVTDKIRHPKISKLASKISSIDAVRKYLLSIQRSIAEKNNVIMDGRDIGTVVLPGADIKIFLTASLEERAKRRVKQLKEKGIDCDYNSVLVSMKERDYNDVNRTIAPLKPAKDSIIYDSTNRNFEDVITYFLRLIRGQFGYNI